MLCDTDAWKFEEYEDETGCADGKKGRQTAYSYYDTSIETSITTTLNVWPDQK